VDFVTAELRKSVYTQAVSDVASLLVCHLLNQELCYTVFLVYSGIASSLMRCIENPYLTASAEARRMVDTFEISMSSVTMACEPSRIEGHGDNVGFRA
jgi:hypothetical protein